MKQSLMIQNLVPSLPEIGKIKIGRKGEVRKSSSGNEFQPPQKLPYFLITRMVRGQDGNFVLDAEAHKRFGDKPTRLPVRLLFDDIELNFQSRRAAYKGRALWCSGDNVTAMRMQEKGAERVEVQCPCPHADPTYEGALKCKMNGRLSVILDGVGGVGGVYKFRTTSYNSIVGLISTLMFLKRISGGPLAGIPLDLCINPRAATDPISGQQQTIYVVSLEYRGGDIERLASEGVEILKRNIEHKVDIAQLENQARKLLTGPGGGGSDDDDEDDFVDTHYPEQAAAAEGVPLATQGQPPTTAGGSQMDRFDAAHGAQATGEPPVTAPDAKKPGRPRKPKESPPGNPPQPANAAPAGPTTTPAPTPQQPVANVADALAGAASQPQPATPAAQPAQPAQPAADAPKQGNWFS